jgi:ribosomal protein L20A (L18A)
MKTYKIIGESREVGAIGIFEPFTENILAESSKDAYEQARNNQYRNNREHIHIKEIRLIREGRGEIIVEPGNYL